MFLNIWVPSLVSKYDTWGGSRTKVLPYTNFYVEVLTQFKIKLLHVEQGSIFHLMCSQRELTKEYKCVF